METMKLKFMKVMMVTYIDLKDALYQSIDNFIDSMENEKETITGPVKLFYFKNFRKS